MKRFYLKETRNAARFSIIGAIILLAGILAVDIFLPLKIILAGAVIVEIILIARASKKGGIWLDFDNKTIQVVNTHRTHNFKVKEVKEVQLQNRFANLITNRGSQLIFFISTPYESVRPKKYQEVTEMITQINNNLAAIRAS